MGSWSGERLRLLSLMRVVGPGVDLQLAQLLGPEPIVRQHPLDGSPDDLLGAAREQLAEGVLLEAAGIAAVAAVELAFELVARDRDAAGVEHDHVIARVETWYVARVVRVLQ